MAFAPAYLALGPERLRERAHQAIEMLGECRLCPRDCGVDRRADRWSACKTGRYAVVTSAFAHMGEEDCLRGWNGSGTIFFGHCNLRCVFCQNFDISQGIRPRGAPTMNAERIAALMLRLQGHGCHNINFVTPEHVVPQVIEAIAVAADHGLDIPIVYNTSAYDAHASLRLLDGIVDIYMPDFKLWSEERSRKWLKAADYPESARTAIREMHHQVGDLLIGPDGIARRGLLIRHLVMPGALDETIAILRWIAATLGAGSYVNLMDQYRPAGTVSSQRHPELARRLERAEFRAACEEANRLGLRLDTRF